MHFAYLGIKAERFSQLPVQVEKAAVEKTKVVMVKGLLLVQRINAKNWSLIPFTCLSPPISHTEIFVDSVFNIIPLALRQKNNFHLFQYASKTSSPSSFLASKLISSSLPTPRKLACSSWKRIFLPLQVLQWKPMRWARFVWEYRQNSYLSPFLKPRGC